MGRIKDSFIGVLNSIERLEKVTESNRIEIMRVYKNLPKIYAKG